MKTIEDIRTIERRLMEESLVEPLNPGEAVLLHGAGSVHIICMLGFDCPFDVDSLRESFPLTLLRHPRFSSILVGDIWRGLKWVQIPRANIDIDDHIIVPIIEDNSFELEKYLEDYLHNLTKEPMDISKPLWEFHVLNLKTSKANSIGIFRIHHSVGDGVSLVSLLLACSRQVSNPNALPTIPTSKKKKENEFKSFISVVWWWLQVIWNTISGVLMFLATTMFLKDSNVFVVAPHETKFKPRRIVHKIISLDDMKLIKNAMNVSLDDMMNKAKMVGWGNMIAIVLFPISLRLLDDPLDYIRKAKAKSDRKKQSLEAHYNIKIGEMAMKLFGTKIGAIFSLRALENTSVLVSNLPGPSEEISFLGHPITFTAPTVFGVPQPLAIYLQSYTNNMSIVISVREDACVDAHQLCDDIVDSFALLKDVIGK